MFKVKSCGASRPGNEREAIGNTFQVGRLKFKVVALRATHTLSPIACTHISNHAKIDS
jgi:hypothetical protein